MSSLNDVQNAMVNVIAPAMYPKGYSSASILGMGNPVFVAPGDFHKLDLDAGLAVGNTYVSVFAVQGMTRSTTRVRRTFVDDHSNFPANLTLTISGNTVTVGGSLVIGEAAMVIVDNIGYATGVLIGSTLTTVAAALAEQIPYATSVGAVITIQLFTLLSVNVSVQGTSRSILFSRESIMRARVIANNYNFREIVGDAIDVAFGLNGYYMPMPDLISASIKPNKIMEINMHELANAFVRDYLYLVEYHTTDVETFNTITDPYVLETVGVVTSS